MHELIISDFLVNMKKENIIACMRKVTDLENYPTGIIKTMFSSKKSNSESKAELQKRKFLHLIEKACKILT